MDRNASLPQPGTPWQHTALARISQGLAALRDFKAVYVGSGSFTSLWLLRSTVRVSASHPKATFGTIKLSSTDRFLFVWLARLGSLLFLEQIQVDFTHSLHA